MFVHCKEKVKLGIRAVIIAGAACTMHRAPGRRDPALLHFTVKYFC